MPQMVSWAKKYGTELLIFIFMNNWGCPDEFWKQQNPLNYHDELFSLLNRSRKLAEENNINLVAPMLPAASKKKGAQTKKRLSCFKPSIATAQGVPRFEEKFCSFPFHSIFIRADGKVSVCCASWNNLMGDATKHSIEHLWNNQSFRKLRVCMKIGSHTSFCRLCDLPFGLAKANPKG